MTEIFTYGEAKITAWEINHHRNGVSLMMRFGDSGKIVLDTEAVGQLLKIIPNLERMYEAAMMKKIVYAPNPLITGVTDA